MSDSIILEKSMEFSIRIVNLYKYLYYSKKEYVLSKQLLRSGTSICANLHEAKYAQSKNDFVAKNSIAIKEASETGYWLDLLYKTNYLSEKQYASIKNDCIELLKILTSILKKIKIE